jgi:Anti-sigma-K factor rskA, C-terminal/Putative zinc-finger
VRDPDPELAHPEAAGWVLGTLDPDDAEWFAGHLPTCPDCRAAVAEFGPTARLLATAAPADLAPTGLQARTLAGVAQAARETRRSSRWRGWSTRMLALAAAVIIAAGTGIGLLLSGGTPAESYALALHPGTGQSASASGTIRQADSGWSVQLTAVHLPEPPPGQFYQCWWVGPGNGPGHYRLISGGTFTVGPSGTANVQMSTASNPDDFTNVEITLASAAQPGQPGRVVLSGTVNDDD